jgi:hypothetical protein
MTFLKRWLPTFLGFPVGGFFAILAIGSLDTPAVAAAGGLIAGTVIGGAQWLALRPRGIGWRWIALTAAAMAAGSSVSVAVTGAGTERADVLLAGLLTGAAVGAAQSSLLPRGAALWTAISAVAWSLAWLTTSFVIVDIERGYAVFGSSGALVATILTGLALTRLLAVAR